MSDLVMIQLMHRFKVGMTIHSRMEQKLLHLPGIVLLDRGDFFNLGDKTILVEKKAFHITMLMRINLSGKQLVLQ